MEKHKRLIALGDIHGCYHTMCDLFKRIEYSSETDTLVFLGDYIDRGLHSMEVVDTVRRLQQQIGRDKVICLKGNHEKFAIDNDGIVDPLWAYNGGMQTIGSYGYDYDKLKSHIAWFRSLPLCHETEDEIFCHAGLTHPKLSDNSEHDLLWGREWIDFDDKPREKQVIFGHTPSENNRPYMTASGDICIDCGCVFGGNLCAYVKNLETGNVQFVTAPLHDGDKKEMVE